MEHYEQAATELVATLRNRIGAYYRTSCPLYGDPDVPVKSFLWVKVLTCDACGFTFDLFPGYLLAEDRRHPRNMVVCHQCGTLNEVAERRAPGHCHGCGATLSIAGPARRGRCMCPRCGTVNRYPGSRTVPLDHRLFAIEYYNPKRKPAHKGRFFKKPDPDDLARIEAACEHWRRMDKRFVPEEAIPPGDETSRLYRWGYNRYRQLFNPRQLLGLELSCRLIAEIPTERIRAALATNLSDLLRYQNMLCRYDTMALKSLDVFSIHGFPVGLVQCESNLLGITNSTGANVGSGGWSNIVQKYSKAKSYCAAPFEVRSEGRHKVRVPVDGERIGDCPQKSIHRSVAIHCADSAQVALPAGTLDAVFTDPPYFGNVQYGELMDFCYVWLRRLAPPETEGFGQPSTRSTGELTGNVTQLRGLENFAEGLARVYSRMAEALKPGAPLVFTYHHNKLDAYCAVGLAILDAGLVCTAALPCPAEMGGSIHIQGTASSIVDTVFVCRDAKVRCAGQIRATVEDLVAVVAHDLTQLKIAGRTATHGDARCVLFGHLTRVAVEQLHPDWNRSATTAEKLSHLRNRIVAFGNVDVLARQAAEASRKPKSPAPTARAQEIVGALS